MNTLTRLLIGGFAATAVLVSGCSSDTNASRPSTTTTYPTAKPGEPLCTYVDEAAFESMLQARVQTQLLTEFAEADCSDGTWTWSVEASDSMPAEFMFRILDLSFTTVGWVRADGPDRYAATWTGDCSPTLRCEVAAVVTDTTSGSHGSVTARSLRNAT